MKALDIYKLITPNPFYEVGTIFYKNVFSFTTRNDGKEWVFENTDLNKHFRQKYELDDGTQLFIGDKVWRIKQINYVKEVVSVSLHLDHTKPDGPEIFSTKELAKKHLEEIHGYVERLHITSEIRSILETLSVTWGKGISDVTATNLPIVDKNLKALGSRASKALKEIRKIKK